MRLPSVSGQFYPGDRATLLRKVDECFSRAADGGSPKLPGIPRVGIAPHAGYVFSGPTAARTVSAMAPAVKGTVVLVGPNHTGRGGLHDVSLEDFDTPLGPVRNDRALSERIIKAGLSKDSGAHAYEHSLEVQLPFLRKVSPDVSISPIIMGDQSMQSVRRAAGAVIASAKGGEALLASSDFTHCGITYGQPVPRGKDAGAFARERDAPAIERILAMDSEGFLSMVAERDLSICGAAPIAVAIEVAKAWGASKGHLLEYTTSHDVSPGPMAVGYASIVFV